MTVTHRTLTNPGESSPRAGESKNEDGGTHFRPVFVVGCPRSGTTWVQLLLAEHPEVVTAPETQIFAYYLDHFQRQWRREHEGPAAEEQGTVGLSRLLSDQEFDALCRATALRVLRRIATRNPEAGTVVEKSPRHALHVEWIHRLLPEARFLHVIRDPRDTVSSLIAAGRSWGRGWAPKGPVDAARRWVRNVESALRGRDFGELYSEIHYEELKEDAAAAVQRIYRWLELHSEDEICERAAEACRLDRLQTAADGEERPLPGEDSPDGFFRKGEAGGWQDDLTAGQVRVIEHVCRELMGDLGYERSRSGRLRPTARIAVHDGLQRIREAVDWQLERVIRRV